MSVIKKADLAKQLKALYTANPAEFIGIEYDKKTDKTKFFTCTTFLSTLIVQGGEKIERCYVNAEALLAAIRQSKNEIYIKSKIESGANIAEQIIIIGNAQLATRDAPEIDKLEMDHVLLDVEVVDIIRERFTDTFVPTNPQSVFGWTMLVKNKIAHYGSTNGPQAIYETTDVRCENQTVKFHHEACLHIAKLSKHVTDIGVGKTSILVYHENISHYIAHPIQTSSITLSDVIDLLDQLKDDSKSVVIGEKMENLIAFTDKDSKIVFSVKDEIFTAHTAAAQGKNTVEIGEFPCKDTSYSLTLQQVLPYIKVTGTAGVFSLAYSEGKPFIVCFSYIMKEKTKDKKDERRYEHYYLTTAGGR